MLKQCRAVNGGIFVFKKGFRSLFGDLASSNLPLGPAQSLNFTACDVSDSGSGVNLEPFHQGKIVLISPGSFV